MYILSQDAVCTDKNTDLSVAKAFEHCFGLCRRTGTAQIFHPAGKPFQAFTEGLKMLIRQYGCRHQYGHLLIVSHRLKCGTNSHFRFSETYIPANQTVHGAVTFHVCFYFSRRFALVRGILIDERRLQFPL